MEVNFRPTFNYARAKTEIEPFAKGGVARSADEAVVLYWPFALKANTDVGLRGRVAKKCRASRGNDEDNLLVTNMK